MLKPANELRKEMKVSNAYLLKCANEINQFKDRGRAVLTCGSYSCTHAELQYAVDELKRNGYTCTFGTNSHGVGLLIINW
jgi:nitric oxide synthase oxygenase domain/subunit